MWREWKTDTQKLNIHIIGIPEEKWNSGIKVVFKKKNFSDLWDIIKLPNICII